MKLIFFVKKQCVWFVLLACVPWRYHFKFSHPSCSVSWSVHVGVNIVVLFCFMLINQTCPFAVCVKPVIFLDLSPGLYQFYSVFPKLSACFYNVLNGTCSRKHFHTVISPSEVIHQETFILIWWYFLYKLYLTYVSYDNLWWHNGIHIPAAGDLQRPYNISDELGEWELYIA